MYKKVILKNGLKVVTSEMPHMESVSIGIWIGVGGRYERKPVCGMSHLLEHMLFKGTAKRTANDLKESIEGVGGSFNGFTSEEVTCYLVKLPSEHTELGLDVLSDMVLNPALDGAELEKEKNVICEEIKMYMDQPAHHVFDILAEIMWPHHALGRPITGYIKSLKGFTRDNLVKFKNNYYQPANITVAACGKVDKKKIDRFAKDTFSMPSSWRRFSFDHVKNSHKESGVKFQYKNVQQAHVAFGFHSMERAHRLRYALGLMNIILGGNMSSRLFERLREKKALCYDISSSIKRYKETGATVIHAGVDGGKALAAAREVMSELKEIKKNNVTEGELKRAKEYARGQMLLALEDTGSRMLWIGERIVTEEEMTPVKEIFRRIDKVKAEDIKEAANMVFNMKNLSLAMVGPGSTRDKNMIRKALEI